MKKGVKMPLFSHNKKEKDKEKQLNGHQQQINNNNHDHPSQQQQQQQQKQQSNGDDEQKKSVHNNNGKVNNGGSAATGGVHQESQSPSPSPTEGGNQVPVPVNKPKLVFHCQQAQGSPTGLISGFSNVKELYQKISNCYGFPYEDILFCTLNTHRIDMDNLLSAQLCLDDFIFVHRKGTKKEVEVVKSEEALGLTITDNGTGYAFIKRIKEDSIIDNIKAIHIGDHIERIDGETLVGWRHVDVAKYLKGIPVGTTFTLRLVEPLRAGFANIGPKSDAKRKTGKGMGSGRETLRFRSNGPAQIEKAPDDLVRTAIDKINRLLENFMGINDADLATQIWEMADGKSNTMDFAEAVDNSELESFGFTDDFIIEVWGIVTDAKSGRLNNHSSTTTTNTPMNNSKSITDVNQDDLDDQDLAYLMMNSTPGRRSRAK